MSLRMDTVDGPYFEDLNHGQRFGNGPGRTLTEGWLRYLRGRLFMAVAVG